MIRASFTLITLLVGLFCVGQAGTLDLTFNPQDDGFGIGDGATNTITAMAVQLDGKIVVGGREPAYYTSGKPTLPGLVGRFNVDGSVDTSFNIGSGITQPLYDHGPHDRVVNAIVVQPDGKILVGGKFDEFDGTSVFNLVRLMPDGSIDPTFNLYNFNDEVLSIAVKPDGDILVGGRFGNNFRRLSNLGGSIGPQPLLFMNGAVHAIAVESDGNFLLGGEFTIVEGQTVQRLLRMTFVNGWWVLDNTFTPSCNGTVRDIKIRPNGRVLVAGDFTLVNNVVRERIAELFPNGSLNGVFNFQNGCNAPVRSIALKPDSRLAAVGDFTQCKGTTVGRFAMLTAFGTLDQLTSITAGANGPVNSVEVRGNGRLVLGGDFTTYDGQGPANRLVELLPNGLVAAEHMDNGIVNDPYYGRSAANSSRAKVLNDGRIFVAGNFGYVNGTPMPGAAILSADGAVDTTFDPGQGLDAVGWFEPGYTLSRINFIEQQDDGKILVGGLLGSYNGRGQSSIHRILLNGDVDSTWQYPIHTLGPADIHAGILTSTGKILYAVPHAGGQVELLLPDGTSDPNFSLTTSGVLSLDEGPNGDFYIAGYFTDIDGTSRKHVARITATGAVDPAFDPGSGPDSTVTWVLVRPNGKVLIGGSFSSYQGVARPGVAQLLPDGSLDTSFLPPAVPNKEPLLQPNGKLVLDGMHRLLEDGSLDPSFAGVIPDLASFISLDNMKNGDVLISGGFTSINGIGRNRIALINGDLTGNTFLQLKVMLEGPFDPMEGMMNDALRSGNYIPLTEPFTALGISGPLSGSATTNEALLSAQGPNAPVDWVLVELRRATNPTVVLESRACLVQRDGDVMRPDGIAVIGFNAVPGDYYVVIRHRNHLGIMIFEPVQLTSEPLALDLTDPSVACYGTDARKNINGNMVLWQGDVTGEGLLQYTGLGNDRDPILVGIGGSVPTHVTNGYHVEDVNMDGEVRYTGPSNDRDPILVNVGGSVPTNTRQGQLP